MKEREANLQYVWNNDAPEGRAWLCPDCDSWATIGGNAGFHAKKTGHRVPTLGKRPKKEEKISDKTIQEWADRYDFQGSLVDLRCAFEDAATHGMMP